MTTTGTLCFIERDGKFLMLRKADKLFGGGKWNAPGGKIADGETAETCAAREVLEETGLEAKNLEHRGLLNFFNAGKLDWSVHVFVTHEFNGSPKAGREGELRWIAKDDLPFDQMWEDDQHWLPMMLEGKRFEGNFYFMKDFQKLLKCSIKEL